MDALYFGTAFPNGEVTPADWQRFVTDDVTPRFPNGLTSWSAEGRWRGASGVIQKESSYVLLIVHSDGSNADAAIRELTQVYKTRFQQEAVMRVRSAACISF